MDHGNEFRGSRNGGREVWVGLEWSENRKIRRPTVAAAAVFAGQIWARPAVVRREISRPTSSGGGAPPCPACVARWWPKCPPRPKPVWPKNGSKRPSSGFTGFGEFL